MRKGNSKSGSITRCHSRAWRKGRSPSIKPWRGGRRLWFGQVEPWDGSLGSGTALLHAPYTDNPADRGLAVLNLPSLRKRVMEAYQNGYSVAIHAIGDRAVTNSLKAIESARKNFPRIPERPHRACFPAIPAIRSCAVPPPGGSGIRATGAPGHGLGDGQRNGDWIGAAPVTLGDRFSGEESLSSSALTPRFNQSILC